MVKTKRKSNRKSVSRKTAKNKSNNLQIFKQKLKKIQRDLVKLNKKYDVKTKKQHYKSKLLKGGETIADLVDNTPSTLPPGAKDLANKFKQSAEKSNNPNFLSELMILIKQLYEAIADLFKVKSTYEEVSVEEQAAREGPSGEGPTESGVGLSEKTRRLASTADDYADLARQLY